MKIPFSHYEILWHRSGEAANHYEERISNPDRIKDKVFDRLPLKVRSTSEEAIAQRIRSQFKYLAGKAIQSTRASHSESVLTPQAPAGDASMAGKNRKAANEALEMVRLALYNKDYGSYKSNNKFKLSDDSETKRMAKAKVEWYDPEEGTDARLGAALMSQTLWRSTAQTCAGLTMAAVDYISHKHPKIQASYIHLSGDAPAHSVATVGTIDAEYVNSPLASWPAHIYVCDPWANIVCPAPDYPAQFAEKMKKWEKVQKQIFDDRSQKWIWPTDENWTSCVNGAPHILTRVNYRRGQFEYSSPEPQPGELRTPELSDGH